MSGQRETATSAVLATVEAASQLLEEGDTEDVSLPEEDEEQIEQKE